MNIQTWLKQPTTITGVASIATAAVGIIAHVLTHDTTVTAGIGAFVFAAVHIAMPDNTGAPTAIEKLVVDAVTAAANKKLAASMPQLFADAMAVLPTVQPVVVAPVVVPVAPAPVAVAPAATA